MWHLPKGIPLEAEKERHNCIHTWSVEARSWWAERSNALCLLPQMVIEPSWLHESCLPTTRLDRNPFLICPQLYSGKTRSSCYKTAQDRRGCVCPNGCVHVHVIVRTYVCTCDVCDGVHVASLCSPDRQVFVRKWIMCVCLVFQLPWWVMQKSLKGTKTPTYIHTHMHTIGLCYYSRYLRRYVAVTPVWIVEDGGWLYCMYSMCSLREVSLAVLYCCGSFSFLIGTGAFLVWGQQE